MFILLFCGIGLIWYLWFYNSGQWEWSKIDFRETIIEKDYKFLVQKTSKRTWEKAFKDRLLISLIFALLTLLFNISNEFSCSLFFIIGYLGQYKILQSKYKKKLSVAIREFPYLLDKIGSLIQLNSVPVTLQKALPDAPDLFQDDLQCLVQEIHDDGLSITPYLKFAEKFKQVPDINSIMRTLYTLTISSNNREDVIISFCNLANEKLIKQRQIQADDLLDQHNLFSYALYASMGVLILMLFTAMNFFQIGAMS